MKYKILFICLLCMLLNSNSYSQSVSGVPVDIQMIMIPKILSYNKNLSSDAKIGIGVIFNSSLRNSAQIKDDILRIAAEKKPSVKGSEIIFVPVDIAQKQNITELIRKENLKALYITPLRSYNISSLLETCKGEKVLSFTDVPEFVEYGVGIYFDLQNNKPRINVNLKSVESDGASFPPEFLKVTNVVK